MDASIETKVTPDYGVLVFKGWRDELSYNPPGHQPNTKISKPIPLQTGFPPSREWQVSWSGIANPDHHTCCLWW